MLLPVVRALLERYPHLEIILVSRPWAKELFAEFPQVRCVHVDLKGVHKGVRGMWRLARELHALRPYSAIADMHAVLRSFILCFFLRLLTLGTRTPIAHLHKGRKEKRALTKPRHKEKRQLMHTVERYARVLERVKYPVKVSRSGGGTTPCALPERVTEALLSSPRAVGMAPFAQHVGKCYPLEQMGVVLHTLVERGYTPWLFGGGKTERAHMAQWKQQLPSIVVVPEWQLSLREEVAVMGHLPLMVTMDSANMHLAAWSGTRVLSLWGATHPYAGFLGWGLNRESVLQDEALSCRPCSIFGNKPCVRGDYACWLIAPEVVVERIVSMLTT